MTGSIRPWQFFFKLLLVFLFTWIGIVLILGGVYVYTRVYPPCPQGLSQLEGFEPVEFFTVDGYRLRGWWRSPSDPFGQSVILLGGLGATRDSMLPEAELLSKHGFGVLTSDYRHCAGGIATLGYKEVYDLAAMLSFLKSQPEVKKIGVLGFSVGGTTAILGAARFSELRAVVAEGNNANLYEEMHGGTNNYLSIEWQIRQAVMVEYWLLTGVSPAQIDPLGELQKLQDRPVFLIHGEEEALRNRADAQCKAVGNRCELWIVPSVGHGGYYQAAPEIYEKRLVEFFQTNLK
jgi:dipeptidyl aminopeptidase/acylaminoacyl peptidase